MQEHREVCWTARGFFVRLGFRTEQKFRLFNCIVDGIQAQLRRELEEEEEEEEFGHGPDEDSSEQASRSGGMPCRKLSVLQMVVVVALIVMLIVVVVACLSHA